jgi:hypothetical protein
MAASESLLDLINAAQEQAKTHQTRIDQILATSDANSRSAEEVDALQSATKALETATIDAFSLFEARMQHHFKRGPFSRKLTARLREAGETKLTDQVHQYYLAANVLKHGKGASHRELLKTPTPLVTLRSDEPDAETPTSLIDVTTGGFFDGLCATIIAATHFLENK